MALSPPAAYNILSAQKGEERRTSPPPPGNFMDRSEWEDLIPKDANLGSSFQPGRAEWEARAGGLQVLAGGVPPALRRCPRWRRSPWGRRRGGPGQCCSDQGQKETGGRPILHREQLQHQPHLFLT